MTAPDAARSAVPTGMVLERLTRGHLYVAGEDAWPLVAAEQEALQRLDVPYFTWPLVGGGTRWHGGELSGPAGPVRPLADLLMDESDLGVSRQHLLDLIAASAQVVLGRQQPDSGGWLTMPDSPALTGLAHGASGMALALVEAAVALGDTSLIEPALR